MTDLCQIELLPGKGLAARKNLCQAFLPNLANAWQASPFMCRLRSSRQGGRDSRQGGRNVGNNNGDDGEEMNIKMLRMSVPGEPGVVRNPIIIYDIASKLV